MRNGVFWAILFAVGLMCKPMLVSLPLTLVLLAAVHLPWRRAQPWVALRRRRI